MSKEEEPRASFANMKDSTQADWMKIGAGFVRLAANLPDRVMQHLMLLEGDFGGFPVDRLTHSLQCATLAHADGRDEEYIVCALLHDIGDTLGSYNHPDIAAAILKPFVSEENLWMIEKHGVFQGHYFFQHIGLDRDMREQYRGHRYFDRTAEFCEKYDGRAFDASAATRPLTYFEPMLRRVLARPRRSVYAQAAVRSDTAVITASPPEQVEASPAKRSA